MGNFDMYFSDKEREEAEAAEITPIVCGDPTAEEAQEAFDKMFEESEAAFEKMFKEVWKK